jgi:Flp pilus assembly protein TadG
MTMHRFLRALQSRKQAEQGSLSLMLAIVAVAIFAVLALVVDGGGRLQALAKAEGTAQEAARTGAQSLNYGQAISGNGFSVDTTGGAVAAAQAYLRQAGVSGTVTPQGNRLDVTVTATYSPVFPFFGAWQVTGHGSAQLVYQAGG